MAFLQIVRNIRNNSIAAEDINTPSVFSTARCTFWLVQSFCDRGPSLPHQLPVQRSAQWDVFRPWSVEMEKTRRRWCSGKQPLCTIIYWKPTNNQLIIIIDLRIGEQAPTMTVSWCAHATAPVHPFPPIAHEYQQTSQKENLPNPTIVETNEIQNAYGSPTSS